MQERGVLGEGEMVKMLAIVGLVGMLATALTSYGREGASPEACAFTALGDVAACD